MAVKEGPESEPTLFTTAVEIKENHFIEDEIIECNSVENMDIVMESPKVDHKIEITKDINVNDVFIVDNKVITASELMSETLHKRWRD